MIFNNNKTKAVSKNKTFGVCVKALDFPNDDLSPRLVEWIELVTILGADKIYMYLHDVHPNVFKVRKPDLVYEDGINRFSHS